MENYQILAAFVFAAAGALNDLWTRRIPNWLTWGGLLAALLLRAGLEGWKGMAQATGGALIGGGVFLVLYFMGGMGGGDVKLMAAVGAWVGAGEIVEVIIVTALCGGILALICVAWQKRIGSTIQNVGELLSFHLTSGLKPHPTLNLNEAEAIRIPYGLAIAMGTFCVLGSTLTKFTR
jgi:prepilin peptidase CpaA